MKSLCDSIVITIFDLIFLINGAEKSYWGNYHQISVIRTFKYQLVLNIYHLCMERLKITSLTNNCSIIIVTYDHIGYIEKCLNSISKYSANVIIVDNHSADGTADFIEKNYPEITLIKNPENMGFGAAVNFGVKQSKKEYVVIMNPDVTTEGSFVEELIRPIEENGNVLTTPKTMLYDGSKINTCGNISHFTGLAFTLGLGSEKDEFNDYMYISGLSGVCFAIRRDMFLEIGGFDESLFLYMEDTELSWNINSRGLKILYVPTSIIYHDYKLTVPAEKIYHLEKGRYTILKRYLTWREYILFSPSLMIAELYTWGYSMLNGYSGIKFKWQAVKDGWRSDVKKKEGDRKDLINSLEWEIPADQLNYSFLDRFIRKLGNYMFFLNYSFILILWNLRTHTPNDTRS